MRYLREGDRYETLTKLLFLNRKVKVPKKKCNVMKKEDNGREELHKYSNHGKRNSDEEMR